LGDLVLLSNNKQLLHGVNQDLIPVIDIEDKKTVKDKEINLDNIIESIVFTFNNQIGEFSNMATTFLNRTPKTKECKQKYLDNVDYISVLNGKEIDKAKTGITFYCPKHISKDAKPLPYFMKFAGIYYFKQKLSSYESNMNLLCWELEKWEKKIKTRKKRFNWNILINKDIERNQEKFIEIYDLYKEFKELIEKLRLIQYKLNHFRNYHENSELISQFEIDNKQVDWERHYQPFRNRANKICSDQKELANYVVEICYKMFPKGAKNFAWVVAKNGMIENIKQIPIELPINDVNGSFVFLGKNYSLTNSAV
jgi:hypothetical protein